MASLPARLAVLALFAALAAAMVLLAWPRRSATEAVTPGATRSQRPDLAPLAPPRDAGPVDGGGGDGALPGATLAGRVLGAGGRGLAGATLTLRSSGALDPVAPGGVPRRGAWLRLEAAAELGVLKGPLPYPTATPADLPPAFAQTPPRSGSTDGEGRFLFAGLGGGPALLVASHPDFADGQATVELRPGATTEVTVTLRPGLAVALRLLDERRRPVAGAEVWAAGLLLGRSDGAGQLALRLEGEAAELEIRAPGFRLTRRTVEPARERAVEVTLLAELGRITGVAVDERGFPVAGASLRLVGPGGERLGRSDAGGEFLLEGIGAGSHRLEARHDEHPTVIVDGAREGDDLRVLFEPGAGLEGEVVDPRTGSAPPGTEVSVEGGGLRRRVLVEGRGHFRLLGLVPGRVEVRAVARGYVPAGATLELPGAVASRQITVRDLRLQLHLGGTISGQLRDRYGAPEPGVEVLVAGAQATTDGAGRFRLGPLAPGRYEVRAGERSGVATVDAGGDTAVELRSP